MGWCSLNIAVRQLNKGDKRSRSGLARGSEESLTELSADLGMEWEDNLRDSHPISECELWGQLSSVTSGQAVAGSYLFYLLSGHAQKAKPDNFIIPENVQNVLCYFGHTFNFYFA